MKNIFIILLTVLCITKNSNGQQIDTVLNKNIGGSGEDILYNFYKLNNNNYIFVGTTNSQDGDVLNNEGFFDCWFTQLDSNLNVINSYTFGGSDNDYLKDVMPLSDTSFLLLIDSRSTNGSFNNSGYGFNDVWIKTYYPTINSLSQGLVFGGSANDDVVHINKKNAGGYIISGESESSDGNLPGNYGQTDLWVLNLLSNSSVAWSKNYGGSGYDHIISSYQLDDGNIMVFGNTYSNDNMVHGNHGSNDLWVLKLNSLGDTLWTKCIGGSQADVLYNVKKINDNEFALIGMTKSLDGDLFYVKNTQSKVTPYDGFYHVIDANGQFQYGGRRGTGFNKDMGFYDLIYNDSNDIDVFGIIDYDSLNTMTIEHVDICMLNSNGFTWGALNSFGGDSYDGSTTIKALKIDSMKYIIATNSFSTNLTSNYHGEGDVWLSLIEKSSNLSISELNFSSPKVFPNPATSSVHITNLSSNRKWHYAIYDVTGKVLLSDLIKKDFKIDISTLGKGIYIIAFSDGLNSYASKLIKE